MNMKKMKKFFTLSRRAEGFTLVELIVVIAILAILGGVAVPAYGGYVKKANMQADISLASEVADALTLYYYSNPSAATIDYVLLTSDGAVTADGITFADHAMQAVFGEGWQDACALKYDGWTTAETAQKVIGSSYLSNGRTADDLLNSVSILTNMAASAMGSGSAETLVALQFVDDSFLTDLPEVGTEGYQNAVGNALVFYVAEDISNYASGTTEELSDASMLALDYAALYAYYSADAKNGADKIEELNRMLADASASGSGQDKLKALNDVIKASKNEDVVKYEEENPMNGEALVEILKAATDMSDSIKSSSDMTSSDMWISPGVSSTVNKYFDAMNVISGLGAGKSGILIMIDENGTISIPTNNVFE